MPAYIIVEIDIEDHTIYEEYKKLTPAAITAYDGKFVVRGAKTECLEGDWHPERLVVLEFPSVERAKEWWSSPEYSEAKSLRQQSAKTKMILMEGVEK
ncbi:MAG: DUF1330 domain-containing protein [Ginsengibacter sp.]